MALSQSQRAIIEKARALGGGGQAVSLDEGVCAYLTGVIVADLGLGVQFPEIDPVRLPHFFGAAPLEGLSLQVPFLPLFERLVSLDANADTYFACLAGLHKARLKYERILQTQAIATIDQVGPRGLLQYGTMSPKALTGFLLWRKWLFDIDNRAAQETGYLFEPIIAAAIGGVPVSAKKSPVRRQDDPAKGRQVDCIREKRAYEIKIRVTIAASGQGRWREELEFPGDCRTSGYLPVLVVLDPTVNPKLDELQQAFLRAGGEVHIGAAAWNHLQQTAGTTMARFLEKYVHDPFESLLAEVPATLPDLVLTMDDEAVSITVGGEVHVTKRSAPEAAHGDSDDDLPEDVEDQIGP
jgi:hypothetical protein